jgi:hypothetical protein
MGLLAIVTFDIQQLGEQRPVVHERLSEVVGARQPLLIGLVDRVGGPVVLGHLGVVDRDVGSSLLEVVDRVAPVAHDLGHQAVGLAGGCGRVVHEPALGGPPCLEVAVPGGGLEGNDVELLAPLLAGREVGFGAALVAGSGDSALVLGPELLLQSSGAPSLAQDYRR